MTPVTVSKFDEVMDRLAIQNVESATIRQIAAIANSLEKECGEAFVHLELGNPGLPPSAVGIAAEVAAIEAGVPGQYPPIQGIPAFKENASKFIKAFMDVDIPSRCIVPTVGSMQGCFTTLLLAGQRLPGKDSVLFLAPGFAAQVHQAKVLGLRTELLDIYEHRGKALEEVLEKYLSSGRFTAMVYNTPNNPAWTNFTHEELEIIGRMATAHDVIVIEDHAYMGMDFRNRYGVPYKAPFIPSVAKYTDNYILMLSGSKIFSYAGQRIAMVAMGEKVFDRQYDFFREFYNMPSWGDAYIFGVLYCASSGTSHSAQHAMAAMMGAAVDGKLDFVSECAPYGQRAAKAKKVFLDNGFHITYSHDGESEISDGFFFTAGYGDMTSSEVGSELMRYGVAALPLTSTGSGQNGVRVCVSLLRDDDTFSRLRHNLEAFHRDHPLN